MWKRALCLFFCICLALFLSPGPPAAKRAKKKKEDPKYNIDTWVATADEVIAKMFEMGKVGKNDVIFDLGCGDNRICFMAAKKFGCRGVGIETNPKMIHQAMDMFVSSTRTTPSLQLRSFAARRNPARRRPRMKDLRDATVVVMYMFPEFMDFGSPSPRKR